MKQDRRPSLDARKLRAEGKGDRERALEYARALRANTPGEQTDPAIVVWAEHGDLAPFCGCFVPTRKCRLKFGL